jgi:hypothetical protein
MDAPTSEMDSVSLLRWAETTDFIVDHIWRHWVKQTKTDNIENLHLEVRTKTVNKSILYTHVKEFY